MNGKFLRTILYCCVVLMACNNSENASATTPEKEDTAAVASYTPQTALDMEPAFRKTDSLQFLYYDNPDGDSLRYSRFFSFLTTKDTASITAFLENLNQPFQQISAVKNCRSEGKIYAFGAKQELKTVYFSTRCDSCCYLYYIKDGSFYYTTLSETFRNTLLQSKKISEKP